MKMIPETAGRIGVMKNSEISRVRTCLKIGTERKKAERL